MSEDFVNRLIDNIVKKLTSEVEDWSSNMRLKIEAELYGAASAVVDKYAGALEDVEKEVSLEREYRLYDAVMQGRREKLRIVEEAYSKVVEEVRRRIREARGSDLYRDFLESSIRYAASTIGEDLVITVNNADKDDAEAIVRKLGLRADVVMTNEDILGIVASSRDGSVRFDGTLESRMMLISDLVRSLLLKYSYTQGRPKYS